MTTPDNRNGIKITVSRKKAKILTVNRKSHYPIETPLEQIFCDLTSRSVWPIKHSYHESEKKKKNTRHVISQEPSKHSPEISSNNKRGNFKHRVTYIRGLRITLIC